MQTVHLFRQFSVIYRIRERLRTLLRDRELKQSQVLNSYMHIHYSWTKANTHTTLFTNIVPQVKPENNLTSVSETIRKPLLVKA